MQRRSSRFTDTLLGRSVRRGRSWMRGLASLGILTALMAVAQPPQQEPGAPAPEESSKKAGPQAANAERGRQVADDTSRLLELATQLKAEVDKTSQDTLSINVIRKAESIEKLAKGMKEEMKHKAGAS